MINTTETLIIATMASTALFVTLVSHSLPSQSPLEHVFNGSVHWEQTLAKVAKLTTKRDTKCDPSRRPI